MQDPEDAALLQELIEEVVLTFRQLRVASSIIHGDGAPIPGQRGVLIDLAHRGPQTVSGMARARGASRQHIQGLVNDFKSRGLVEFGENPAHRRSKLVHLTPKGKTLVKTMGKNESAAISSLGLTLDPGRIRRAAEVLRTVRERLQTFSWERRRR